MNLLNSSLTQPSLIHRFEEITQRQTPVKVTAAAAPTNGSKSYTRDFSIGETHGRDQVQVSDWSYNMMEAGNCPKMAACPLELSRLNMRLNIAEAFDPQQHEDHDDCWNYA